jgi:hypothetical protein
MSSPGDNGWGFFAGPGGAPPAAPPRPPLAAPVGAPPPAPVVPPVGAPLPLGHPGHAAPEAIYPVPVPHRGGLPAWGIVLIVIAGSLAALMVILVLLAIAIPVFLNQRHKAQAASYSVVSPRVIDGFTPDLRAAAIDFERSTIARLPAAEAARTTVLVYNDSTGRVLNIVVVHEAVLPGRVDTVVRGEQQGLERSTGRSYAFAEVAPGALGGAMRCASVRAGVTTCLFADQGTYGSVSVPMIGAEGVDEARRVREAVIQHH